MLGTTQFFSISIALNVLRAPLLIFGGLTMLYCYILVIKRFCASVRPILCAPFPASVIFKFLVFTCPHFCYSVLLNHIFPMAKWSFISVCAPLVPVFAYVCLCACVLSLLLASSLLLRSPCSSYTVRQSHLSFYRCLSRCWPHLLCLRYSFR